MGFRTITVEDEIYQLLMEMKNDKERLNEVLKKAKKNTKESKSNILAFFGVLKDSKILEDMEKEILETRKKSGIRDVFA